LLHHKLDIGDLEANLAKSINSQSLTLEMQNQLSTLLNARVGVRGLEYAQRASYHRSKQLVHSRPIEQNPTQQQHIPLPSAKTGLPQRALCLIQDFLLGTGGHFDVMFFDLQKKGARLAIGEVQSFSDVLRPAWVVTSLDMRG
jgi:hypothetical protein